MWESLVAEIICLKVGKRTDQNGPQLVVNSRKSIAHK